MTNFNNSSQTLSELTKIDSNVYLQTQTSQKIITTVRKTFVYDFMTYLKDSNAYGNNYFARYFEWQGVCREAWFYHCISADFLQPIGIFITKLAHNELKNRLFHLKK